MGVRFSLPAQQNLACHQTLNREATRLRALRGRIEKVEHVARTIEYNRLLGRSEHHTKPAQSL